MRVENVDLPAKPPPALLERTHDAVVAVVEDTFERLRRDETLPRDTGFRRGRGREHAADFCRHHELVARVELAEEAAQTLFTQTESVVRSGIEVIHAMA